MSLHTRVVVRGARKGSMYWEEVRDVGAKFRDVADISTTAVDLLADMQKRFGEDGQFKISTCEVG